MVGSEEVPRMVVIPDQNHSLTQIPFIYSSYSQSTPIEGGEPLTYRQRKTVPDDMKGDPHYNEWYIANYENINILLMPIENRSPL
jgi:hypothetical protein